jgi:hypothetical protein
MTNDLFTKADLEQMKQLGITEEEARRQMAILEKGPRLVSLQRPCTPGDGIIVLNTKDQSRLLALWEETAAKGRFSVFLPASGAATRMFAFLQRIRNQLDRVTLDKIAKKSSEMSSDRRDLQVFMESLREFAFFEPLAEVMDRAGISLPDQLNSGDYTVILDFLIEAQGLNYASLPKGLIPFHRYSDHYRTALEEHLVEAIHTLRDDKQCCRVHFTVAPENEKEVENHGREAAARYTERFGVQYELSFSLQSPATNTLAVDYKNRPFRRPDGSLLFRPGGHGALLQNLNRCQGDIVFIKNIDNVVNDDRRDLVIHHQRILAGMLVELQDAIFSYLRGLRAGSIGDQGIQEVLEFVTRHLGASLSEDFMSCSQEEKVSRLFRLLHRPLRVCGMVKHRGEPGGGPFWVEDTAGRLSLQIVENAEIDQDSSEQVVIFGASTHFSPVQIVCGLRDYMGQPFDLAQFADSEAVFVTRKTEYARELKALEFPGLWNGGMAYWNTVLVEIPEETFNPVKTINDLLRPGHLTT